MMNPSDIASIERATLDAVCPAEVHEIPGWLLPYDPLPVGRARSAVPLAHMPLSPAELLPIEAYYQQRDRPTVFRLPESLISPEIGNALQAMGYAGTQAVLVQVAELAGLLRAIVECPLPVIAAVDGHVRAGGMGLVGACDMAVAGPRSTFALTEARIGVAPAIISLTLLPKLAPRAAARYYLTGETFTARRAVDIGLVTVAADDVGYAVDAMTDELSKASPQGLAASKALTTAAVLAGMVWAIENPTAGVVEADSLDHARILEVARPYLGEMVGAYSDWTPLEGREALFPEALDSSDPWQFKNILVS